jgi:hypothetical protein
VLALAVGADVDQQGAGLDCCERIGGFVPGDARACGFE